MKQEIFECFDWFYFEISDLVIILSKLRTNNSISIWNKNSIPTKTIIKSRFFAHCSLEFAGEYFQSLTIEISKHTSRCGCTIFPIEESAYSFMS